jgi:hypothetical protein
MVTKKLVKADTFYKKDKQGVASNKVIMRELRDSDDIVYGARSVNAFVPKYLERHTEDWDIYTDDDPKTVARKMEKALDKHYGGNYFYVEAAKHKGTYKIKSNITKRTIADITIKDIEISKRKIGEINYATLDFQVDKIRSSLASGDNKYRHDKDKETLQRIEIYNKLLRKPVVAPMPSPASGLHKNKSKAKVRRSVRATSLR